MSEITKMLCAVGLLAAGFFSASLFGTSDSQDAGRTLSSEWAPQPLEPIENRAVVPSSAAATWDERVALAAHNDAGASTADDVAYQVARPTWTDQRLAPPPSTATTIPEIRSGEQPLATNEPNSGDPWRQTRPPTDDRFATLAPPPLLDESVTASSLRPSRFPDRPSVGPPAGNGFAPPANSPPMGQPDAFAGPSLAPANDWNTPWPQAELPATTAGEPIWHVVADGDSLPEIAERYLRDASRAREIYNLNRDVLNSPDLLPIGAELRIPQSVAPPSQFEVFDVGGGRSTNYQPQSRLVPLPELPASVRAVPRARLQGPVSASYASSE